MKYDDSLESDIKKLIRRHERSNRQEKSRFLWVWEFSKKLVLLVTLLYVIEQIYAAVAMWIFSDFSYLGTMMEQSSDILKTCVFGYLVKSGIENAFKIRCNPMNEEQTLPEEENPEALG